VKKNNGARLAGRHKTMAYTNVIYHIVFGTKGRSKTINNDIRAELYKYIGGIARNLGGIALEINGIDDHIHILVKLKATIALAEFIRDVKSNSSTWLKKNGVTKFAWQRRYGAFTVSESQVKVVRKYVREQEKHHRKFDYKNEFESMLRVNGIPVDDFVWQD
jgi:putative transposase